MEKNKDKITIVTHSLKFHADDVLAVATLLLILEKENDVTVIRTRDPEIISKADYVVDVGGVDNPEKNRFDHHQEGGAGGRSNGILYSSFGLVWKKFGETLSGNKGVADKIDESLVQPIDAIDNGIEISKPIIENIKPYDIGDFFWVLVPSWKEGIEHIDEMFMQAVSYAKVLLTREVLKTKDIIESKDFVRKIYFGSSDKKLIVLDRYYPTGEYMPDFPEPLFVVFPKSDDNSWVLKAVRENPGQFSNRKSLPQSWAGKRDEELEKVTGVPGAMFCHNGRFIAIAKTKEAILKLAEIALAE